MRRLNPVVVGAVALLLVIGAAAVVRQLIPPPTTLPVPAPAPAVVSDDVRIWSAALDEVIAREPVRAAPKYYILDAVHHNGTGRRGAPFTLDQKTQLAAALAPKQVQRIADCLEPTEPVEQDLVDAGGGLLVGEVADGAE